ncbi:hypothetical protein ACLB2K_068851 [Fragaria x ananassa]
MPLDLFWIWVKIRDLPAVLTTDATVRFVGETIGSVLQVDQVGLRRGTACMRITLPLHKHVRLRRQLRVSSEDVIIMQYMYKHLVERYKDYMMLNHDDLVFLRTLEIEVDT